MRPKDIGALLLIIFGAYFLTKNLNILPSLKVFWPVILIVLGSIALYQALRGDGRPQRDSTWEIEGDSSSFRGLVGILVFIVVGFAALIILGVLAPVFLLGLLFLPLILFFKLGFAFLKLLIPVALLGAPLILIIFLLSLIF